MSHNLSFSVVRVTPAKAREWLLTNTGNRRLSKRIVSSYANAIRRGEWVLNGETIKFSDQGRLLDGQHRLHAIVEAGQPVDVCVIRGIEPKVFGTIDGGKVRTPADFLYVLKYRHPNALARAGRMLFAYEKRKWAVQSIGSQKASNDELLATIQAHPGLVQASERYMRRPYFTPLIPHSVGMLVFYLASRVGARACRQFFEELATGSYAQASERYPPRVLRDRLAQTSLEVIKPTAVTRLIWTITAWNTFRAGDSLTIRQLPRIAESLPRMQPDPVPSKWRGAA